MKPMEGVTRKQMITLLVMLSAIALLIAGPALLLQTLERESSGESNARTLLEAYRDSYLGDSTADAVAVQAVKRGVRKVVEDGGWSLGIAEGSNCLVVTVDAKGVVAGPASSPMAQCL